MRQDLKVIDLAVVNIKKGVLSTSEKFTERVSTESRSPLFFQFMEHLRDATSLPPCSASLGVLWPKKMGCVRGTAL